MHFDVTGPQHVADSDACIEEVGACFFVVMAGVYNGDGQAGCGFQAGVAVAVGSPDIV